jgi:PKD repeat protein
MKTFKFKPLERWRSKIPGLLVWALLACLPGLWQSNQLCAQNMVMAEYFFNSDPGFGNGVIIPVPSPSPNVQNLSFVADVSQLDFGFNTLFVRARDAGGRWSIAQQRPLYKAPAINEPLPDIVQAEYFFNTDPGFGSGINIPLGQPSPQIEGTSFIADVSGLETGFNMLFVRVKAANGRWTLSHHRQLYKAAMPAVLPDVVYAEYFFNTDPGRGNGVNIPVGNASPQIANLSFIADTDALPVGSNVLFVRAKDANGRWTLTQTRFFYKAEVKPLPNIVQCEYYINSDPGLGLGINIPVNNPGINLQNIPFMVDVSGLALGYHKVFLRSKDDSGKWSLTNIFEFCKTPVPDFTTDIAEFGNPTSFTNLTQFADPNTLYFWDVNGDGVWDYTGSANFLHLYSAPGSYMAKLKVQIPQGCFDIIEKEVLVYACMVPTNLTAGNITYNSAELNWTPGNFGNQWDILWGLQGFDPETEGTLIEGVASRPYFLTGLQEQTNYAFYVRTVCDGEVSNWSGPKAFTTLEYICEPEWTVSSYYQFNMQVIGKLFINGVQSFNPNDKIGAFVNGVCRGIASPDPNTFGLVFLSVGSDQFAGDMVEFVIWSVDDCSECPTGVSIIFENQQQIGSPGNPYPFECGQHELSLNFGEGYTWFSANIDPGSMTLNNLFEPLNPCEEDRILGQNTFATWYNNQWMGSLTAINPSWMYKMQLCSQQSMNIQGQPVANNPITLGAGYTWLGYLPQSGLSINDALANITPPPVEDNRLLGQNTFAVFYQGQWIGSLTQLHPGHGYITQLSSQSILQYPNASAKNELLPEEEIFSPTGEQPLANKQYSMMLIAQLELPDGSISLNNEDVIYAYAGNECRGMAIPFREHDGSIFMSIGSDNLEGEVISFRVWLAEHVILAAINESITFEALKKAGTMDQPFILTLKGFNGDDPAGGIFIGEPYPNPFSEVTEIPYRLNETAQVRLSIYNSQGQQLRTITDVAIPAGTHKAAIHRKGLQAGVYFYRMEVFMDGETMQKNGKIIISQ